MMKATFMSCLQQHQNASHAFQVCCVAARLGLKCGQNMHGMCESQEKPAPAMREGTHKHDGIHAGELLRDGDDDGRKQDLRVCLEQGHQAGRDRGLVPVRVLHRPLDVRKLLIDGLVSHLHPTDAAKHLRRCPTQLSAVCWQSRRTSKTCRKVACAAMQSSLC
jgi:hypothetical protein